MKKLVGKTVTNVYVSSGKQVITFELAPGEFVSYECYGDCCSSTWIEHINGLDALLGQVIRKHEYFDMGEDGEDDRDESVQVYEDRLLTDRGVFSIEYRNGSNGYYGGSLEETSTHVGPAAETLTEDF